MDVIYKAGELQIQTIITADNIAAYTGGKTADEYLLELGPDYARMSYQDALISIAKEQQRIFLNQPWQEITEEDWIRALEILPPKNWRVVDGVEFFQSIEHRCNDITLHYAQFDNRYFKAHRSVVQSYHLLASEIIIALNREKGGFNEKV